MKEGSLKEPIKVISSIYQRTLLGLFKEPLWDMLGTIKNALEFFEKPFGRWRVPYKNLLRFFEEPFWEPKGSIDGA